MKYTLIINKKPIARGTDMTMMRLANQLKKLTKQIVEIKRG